MAYTLTQKEYSNLKRRLTTLRNKIPKATTTAERIEAHKKLITECNHAEAVFDEKGYPDAWSMWTRAKEDSEWNIRRMEW